jgi:hypothetical protein
MTTFLGDNTASSIKKARFCTTLFTLLNMVWTLDPVLDLEPELGMEPETKLEPELEPKLFQSQNGNRTKLLRFHDTDGWHSLFSFYANINCRQARDPLKVLSRYQFKPKDFWDCNLFCIFSLFFPLSPLCCRCGCFPQDRFF